MQGQDLGFGAEGSGLNMGFLNYLHVESYAFQYYFPSPLAAAPSTLGTLWGYSEACSFLPFFLDLVGAAAEVTESLLNSIGL